MARPKKVVTNKRGASQEAEINQGVRKALTKSLSAVTKGMAKVYENKFLMNGGPNVYNTRQIQALVKKGYTQKQIKSLLKKTLTSVVAEILSAVKETTAENLRLIETKTRKVAVSAKGKKKTTAKKVAKVKAKPAKKTTKVISAAPKKARKSKPVTEGPSIHPLAPEAAEPISSDFSADFQTGDESATESAAEESTTAGEYFSDSSGPVAQA